ncbi:DUF58 domain-containing protein [Roseisolibacter agri]|uniref:DUF58 domain-containing protein n=1 Tax=Roseisolibacter agri TaxID=2014610 RepID=A0AA37QBI7_9BACT|nr:DUF58 domain-containing protein [Roseisolibacter agri]GLC25866.1 hypothetical protein rosag_23790 [Roseisolibacter agri]
MSIRTHDYAALLDQVRSLRWPARRRVAGNLPGAHRARLRGSTGEFSEYRAYRQGDDPRRLDWRLLARSDRAYVRLADDHALLPTLLLVDASASMAFPEGTDAGTRHAKWRTACALAVGLAAVAHAAGDPVGLAIAGSDGVRTLPPRSRRGVVHELARALDAVAPAGSGALAPLLARVPASSRLVLISDYLGDDADALRQAAGAHAARGGDVHALHVVAAEELAPPRDLALAVDPEDPRLRRPFDAAARTAYVARFAEWRAGLARAWREVGATYALVATDEPPARAVRRIVRGDAA